MSIYNYISTKLEVSTAFLLQEYWRHGTDRWMDRVQQLINLGTKCVQLLATICSCLLITISFCRTHSTALIIHSHHISFISFLYSLTYLLSSLFKCSQYTQLVQQQDSLILCLLDVTEQMI